MKRLTTTLLLSALLTGCAVGPDYLEPEFDFSKSFAEANDANQNEVDVNWWSAFNDETLNTLIADAAKDNKNILQALSRINQSRALARQAFAELLPGTQLRGEYEKSRSSSARFPSGEKKGFNYEIFNGGIDAAWELDIFGRLRREVESRNAAYAGSVASLYDAIRMVTAEVAVSYFQLRSAQAELEIAEKNVKIQDETNNFVLTKVKYGTASELDSARAEAQLETTKASIPLLQLAIKTQIHRLSVLIGKQPTELTSLLAEKKDLPTFNGPLTIGKPEMLLQRRPDLRVAERNLAAQTALIGVAVGELFPKLTINGSLGVEASTFSNLTSGAGTYRYGPSITWTPFDVGRLRSLIKAQDAKTEEALLAYQDAVLRALEDVENSLASVAAQNQRQVSVEKAFQAASRAHKLALEQYEEGVIDFLSVLDAQEVALKNEQEVVKSKEGSILSLVQLYKALGGGWQQWELKENN